MPVASYLKDKQKKIESKYHKVVKRFESQYGLIHKKLTSRFHRETTAKQYGCSKVNNLIQQSTVAIESPIESKTTVPIMSKLSTKSLDNSYQDKIDWTRGRFSGQIIQIFVREGRIVEKVFITPKGNKISVKRLELGLFIS